MIPLELLRQLEDQDLAFVLTRIPDAAPRYRWVCRIGPECDNAIRGLGHSASEAISEAVTKFDKMMFGRAAPSDLNHSWCLP